LWALVASHFVFLINVVGVGSIAFRISHLPLGVSFQWFFFWLAFLGGSFDRSSRSSKTIPRCHISLWLWKQQASRSKGGLNLEWRRARVPEVYHIAVKDVSG